VPPWQCQTRGSSGLISTAEPARVRADVVALAREASNLLDVRSTRQRWKSSRGMRDLPMGSPHQATIEAIRLAGRLEALPLDPVYSGKGWRA